MRSSSGSCRPTGPDYAGPVADRLIAPVGVYLLATRTDDDPPILTRIAIKHWQPHAPPESDKVGCDRVDPDVTVAE